MIKGARGIVLLLISVAQNIRGRSLAIITVPEMKQQPENALFI